MIGRDLVEDGRPSRWIIDFGRRDMTDAMRYQLAFERVKKLVMPVVLAKAEKEKVATGKESTRWSRLANRWWQLRDYQPGTMAAIAKVPRYIACSRVTKRPIFEFISPQIHPDNTLVVFPFADDYSFGILQSGIHWAWFKARCSTLKGDFRYTSDTIFDTFPWPQFESTPNVPPVSIPTGLRPPAQGCELGRSGPRATLGPDAQSAINPNGVAPLPVQSPAKRPSLPAAPAPSRSALEKIRAVAEAAVSLRALRREIITANGWSLRELYRTLETPGANRLRDAQAALDSAVRSAYGMKRDEDPLAFLLRLNLELADKEAKGQPLTPPGLPASPQNSPDLLSADCITASGGV